MRKLLCTLFLGLFLAACLGVAPALAADTDAETRFHEAYLAEVVDGKVAESAKVYLALMNDEKAPKRIRQESQFRFAVCAALLGRADEARSQFDALIANDATETLKARAREYRKGINDVGTGSEHARKLESLVFELAKRAGRPTMDGQVIAQYRQFSVIGDPAIPFLRKLMTHRNAGLRSHAFRILLRMDEPGMIHEIPNGIDLYRVPELRTYVARRADQREALESLAMEDAKRVANARWSATPSFLTAFANVDGATSHALVLAGLSPVTKERLAVLEAWARGAQGDLRGHALAVLLEFLAGKASADLFLPALKHHLTTSPKIVASGGVQSRLNQVQKWAERLTTSQLLDAMDLFLERAQLGQSIRNDFYPYQFENSIAAALQTRPVSEPEAIRYAQIFRTWVEKLPSHEWLKTQASLCHKIIQALPAQDARAFVTAVYSSPVSIHWADVFGDPGARLDADLVLAAAEASKPSQRWWLVRYLPIFRGQGWEGDLARRQLAVVWDAIAQPNDAAGIAVPNLVASAKKQPDAARWILEIAKGTNQLPAKIRRSAQYSLVYGVSTGGSTALTHLARWGLPLLASSDIAWTDRMHRETASWIVTKLAEGKQVVSGEERARLKAFVAKHAKGLTWPAILSAASKGNDIVSYVTWIARIPHNQLRSHKRHWHLADLDAVAEALLANDPHGIHAVTFALRYSEHPTVFADRLLADEDAKARDICIQITSSNGYPASVKALEEALARAIAQTPVSLTVVRGLTSKLVKRSPSARLIAAVRILLQSGDINAVQAAIRLAGDLGSESLLPDLKKLLFSMHKPLRANAKKTIDDINSLVAMRGPAPAKQDK